MDICPNCKQILEKYYVDCIHNDYKQLHEYILKALLRIHCIVPSIDEIKQCDTLTNYPKDLLELFSKLHAVRNKLTYWTNLNGLHEIALITDPIKYKDTSELIDLIYNILKDKLPHNNFLETSSSETKIMCKIERDKMHTYVIKNLKKNIEHILPQSHNHCSHNKNSLINECVHVYDPFNIVYMNLDVNKLRQKYPYGSCKACKKIDTIDFNVTDQHPLVISNKCDNEEVFIEPYSNVGKFIIGSKLIYDYIVYSSHKYLSNIPEIYGWCTKELTRDERQMINDYNDKLNQIFGINYEYFYPDRIQELFMSRKHKCVTPTPTQKIIHGDYNDFSMLIEELNNMCLDVNSINHMVLKINNFAKEHNKPIIKIKTIDAIEKYLLEILRKKLMVSRSPT